MKTALEPKRRTRNPNHPRKRSHTVVYPIERIEDIQSIKRLLANNPRDSLLFVMGVNNGLRVGDLLSLKVKDVQSLREGDCIAIKESKTGKTNILMVNKSVYKALKNYFEKLNPDDNAFLFASRKSKGSLTIQAVNSLVKKWPAFLRDIPISKNNFLCLTSNGTLSRSIYTL